MLLKANYKKSFVPLNAGRGSTTIEVDRGQFIFGRNKASEELCLNGTAVYRILQKFEELKQISIEPNNHYSLITICNYNSYQNIKDKDEQQMNSKRTANEQLMNNKRTANEHIQEELEDKEGKEELEDKGAVIFDEKLLIPSMFNSFKKYLPQYPSFVDKDFKPLFNIAKFLHEQSGLNGDITKNQKEITEQWNKICETISIDNFYKTKTLSTISNQIQEIYQISKNGKSTTSTVGKEIKFDRP